MFCSLGLPVSIFMLQLSGTSHAHALLLPLYSSDDQGHQSLFSTTCQQILFKQFHFQSIHSCLQCLSPFYMRWETLRHRNHKLKMRRGVCTSGRRHKNKRAAPGDSSDDEMACRAAARSRALDGSGCGENPTKGSLISPFPSVCHASTCSNQCFYIQWGEYPVEPDIVGSDGVHDPS